MQGFAILDAEVFRLAEHETLIMQNRCPFSAASGTLHIVIEKSGHERTLVCEHIISYPNATESEFVLLHNRTKPMIHLS